MSAENLSNLQAYVGGQYIGVCDVELPTIEFGVETFTEGALITSITGTLFPYVFDRRNFLEFIGNGYYAKTKGKQPRTVFVRKGW